MQRFQNIVSSTIMSTNLHKIIPFKPKHISYSVCLFVDKSTTISQETTYPQDPTTKVKPLKTFFLSTYTIKESIWMDTNRSPVWLIQDGYQSLITKSTPVYTNHPVTGANMRPESVPPCNKENKGYSLGTHYWRNSLILNFIHWCKSL